MNESFQINASLEFNCCDRMIVQPSSLRKIENNFFVEELTRLMKCNLYAIVRRPRFQLNSGIVENGNKKIIRYHICTDPSRVEHHFDITSLTNEYDVDLVSEGGTDLQIRKQDNGALFRLPIDINYLSLPGIPSDLLKFEILYIGKALGRLNSRNSIQRLSSHSKFQEVLEDLNDNDPSSQAFVMLFDFRHPKVLFLSRPDSIQDERRESERSRLEYLYRNKLERQEYISIIEAILIDYFKPRYNSTFTDCSQDVSTFKIFKYLKKNQIKSVHCIFETLSQVQLYTPSILSGSKHVFERKIFSEDRGFFDLFKKL